MLEEIQKTLADAGVNVSEEDIQKRLDILKNFKVPAAEIKRSVLTYFGVSSKGASGDNPIGSVKEVTTDGMWTSLRVKVVQLWDSNHDSIDQTGLVGDESGTIKFTKWKSANLPPMEEGKSYLLVNVVSNEYNGKMQVSMNKNSKIETSEDVEAKDNTTTFIGAIVAIRDNSGLISRCDECTRAIRGKCPVHLEAGSHHDLRIICTMDNGIECITVIMDASIIESLTGFTVDSSRQMAVDALDKEIVGDRLELLILGKFFYVTGPDLGDSLLARAMMPYVNSIPNKDLKGLIEYIRKE